MKKLLFSFMLLLSIIVVQAQYYYNAPPVTPNGNPGNLNGDYENPFGEGLAPDWVNIQPGVYPGWTVVQTIPFTFKFNGTVETQYKVSTSGVLTFTTSASVVPGSHMTIPNLDIPDKSVCIWGLDFSSWPGANDRIVKKTFGTAPNRQHWIFFASYNIQGGSGQCWTYWSIVLEETTNKIYIVDQRSSWKFDCQTSLTLGIQINQTTATQVLGSPNIKAKAGGNETSSDNKYYEFIHGVRPNEDMAVSWCQTNAYQTKGVPIEIRGTVKNLGLINVTSYRINYRINNGPVKSEKINITNLPINSEEWYMHDSLWDPTILGIYKLKIWADSINGKIDGNTSNDTLYKDIHVMGVFTPKITLHEVFTSSTSEESKIGDDTLKSVLSTLGGQYALVKYQMPSDIYSTLEGRARATFYGIDSVPDMMLDGKKRIYPLVYNNKTFIDNSAPSYMDIQNATISLLGTKVTVTANILPFPEVDTSSQLVYHIAIVEKETKNNASTSGATKFYNVMKKMIPNEQGTALGKLTPGIYVFVNKNYTFTVPHTVENFKNLAAVLFVQNKVTKEVLQSVYLEQPSGISKPTVSPFLNIFPNPGNNQVQVNYYVTEKTNVTFELINLLGEKLIYQAEGQRTTGAHATILNLENLPKGIYFVRINIGGNSYTKKIIKD